MTVKVNYGDEKMKISADETRPKKRQRWFALVMTNGCLHVKEYNGPYDYRRSLQYAQFAKSPLVRLFVPPVSISVNVDHLAIMRKKAERIVPIEYNRGGRFA